MLTLTPAQRRIAARVKECLQGGSETCYDLCTNRKTGSKAEGAKSEQDGQD